MVALYFNAKASSHWFWPGFGMMGTSTNGRVNRRKKNLGIWEKFSLTLVGTIVSMQFAIDAARDWGGRSLNLPVASQYIDQVGKQEAGSSGALQLRLESQVLSVPGQGE